MPKDRTQSETADQCQMNMLIKHFAWSEGEEPSECAKYDNCHRHIKDNPTIRDEYLEDIKKSRKPKLLSTTELVEFALQDLVRRGLVLQDIILSRPYETGYISCTLVIEELSDGAKEIEQE
ncbi:17111_t:CDS:2 [Gigaspora rosea]|nr:17111_t:CDS:2 [Gigaspora rosea]